MTCVPHGTHHCGCDCWEAGWADKLATVTAEKDKALVAARLLRRVLDGVARPDDASCIDIDDALR